MTAFVFGGIVGGAALGGGLGWLGAVARTRFGWTAAASLVALAAIAILGAAFDLRLLPVALPGVHRQVDERWLQRYRGWVYGLGFGFQLGFGVLTIVVSSAIYTAFAAAFLSGSVLRGAVIGAAFGLFRTAIVFVVAEVRRPDQLVAVDRRLRRLDGPSRRASIALEIGLAAVALAVVLL